MLQRLAESADVAYACQRIERYGQVLGAARHFPALLEAVRGIPVLRLAQHKVLCVLRGRPRQLSRSGSCREASEATHR